MLTAGHLAAAAASADRERIGQMASVLGARKPGEVPHPAPIHQVASIGALGVLRCSGEHLFDRRNDEIRLVELDHVPAAGGNNLLTIGRETGEVLLQA